MRRSLRPHRTHHHLTERAWGGANDLPHEQVLDVPIEPGPLLDALRQEGLVYAYDGNNDLTSGKRRGYSAGVFRNSTYRKRLRKYTSDS